MTGTTTREIAERLVAHCRAGTTIEGLDELYAETAQSVEASPMPGATETVSDGREAIRSKHQWWDENFEVQDASVDGPYMHGTDRFAVIFEMDATHKESGRTDHMKEVGIYTVGGGRIVREEFYYTMD